MPRPLIINVESHRRPYHSVSKPESLDFINDDIENDQKDIYMSSKRHGKKSKHASPEKETQESSRRHRGHKRAEKSTITRSKSMADLKRNRRPYGQEEESSKQYHRRHSNTESHPNMFNFRETFSKFETLTTKPQNSSTDGESPTVSSPKARGRSSVEKEAWDLREIDQIKSRARLLVQEARQIGRRDKHNYLEWQDEVVQLLKKIGEIDNRNSEAVQKEKQKTLRIFKHTHTSPEVKKVEKVKTTVARNGLSENKINVYDEVDIKTVNVSQLRNIYESKQSDETPRPITTHKDTKYHSEHHNSSIQPRNLDDSEYTSSSKYSFSSSSGSSEEDEQVLQTHEGEIQEEQPPHERNVEESPIAKVRDLRGVFEKDNYQQVEESSPASTTTITSSTKWIKKVEEEEVPQEESSRIYKVDDQGFIVDPTDDTPKTVRDTLPDEEVFHSVAVKELKNVFEENNPQQNLEEVDTSTMRITLEQRYIPYEESVNDMQQAVIITELNDEEVDKKTPIDTSHIAKVRELKDAIEKNEDTSEVNQVRYQVVSGIKHQEEIEIEKLEKVVISDLSNTNGDGTVEDAHKDVHYGIKEEVTVKPGEVSPEVEEAVKHNVVVKEVELNEQEKVLISKKVLDIINEDIHLYEKEIDNLDSEDEKKRMYLNEMLLRSVIQLENFETYQSEDLLRERKEALLFVRECIRKLKEKIPANTETNA